MDALNGNPLQAVKFKHGNALYLLCNSSARDCNEAEQIEGAFIQALAQQKYHVIRMRSDYHRTLRQISLAAEVVPERLVSWFGEVCYQG